MAASAAAPVTALVVPGLSDDDDATRSSLRSRVTV